MRNEKEESKKCHSHTLLAYSKRKNTIYKQRRTLVLTKDCLLKKWRWQRERALLATTEALALQRNALWLLLSHNLMQYHRPKLTRGIKYKNIYTKTKKSLSIN